jgi:hypothetical protein
MLLAKEVAQVILKMVGVVVVMAVAPGMVTHSLRISCMI